LRRPKRVEWADKPSSVASVHLSGAAVARSLVRPTRGSCGVGPTPSTVVRRSGRRRIAPYLALLRAGVLPAGVSPHRWCALTAPFHPCRDRLGDRGACPRLPRQTTAVCFCATFRRVAPPGRYPAPCPVELGLSSPACAGADAWPTPATLYHTAGPCRSYSHHRSVAHRTVSS